MTALYMRNSLTWWRPPDNSARQAPPLIFYLTRPRQKWISTSPGRANGWPLVRTPTWEWQAATNLDVRHACDWPIPASALPFANISCTLAIAAVRKSMHCLLGSWQDDSGGLNMACQYLSSKFFRYGPSMLNNWLYGINIHLP
jgi:hypothetical protein